MKDFGYILCSLISSFSTSPAESIRSLECCTSIVDNDFLQWLDNFSNATYDQWYCEQLCDESAKSAEIWSALQYLKPYPEALKSIPSPPDCLGCKLSITMFGDLLMMFKDYMILDMTSLCDMLSTEDRKSCCKTYLVNEDLVNVITTLHDPSSVELLCDKNMASSNITCKWN